MGVWLMGGIDKASPPCTPTVFVRSSLPRSWVGRGSNEVGLKFEKHQARSYVETPSNSDNKQGQRHRSQWMVCIVLGIEEGLTFIDDVGHTWKAGGAILG